ncbi:MAG: type VI secretion system baseplate subunit TssE [Gemmatimonadota bacterium]
MTRQNPPGARALLFERLVDEIPRVRAEPRPLRTHDAQGLWTSVHRRLQMLLNTRAPRPRPARGELTVLDYGLPDYSALYTRDEGAHARLAREIQRTIEAFEPRLEVAGVEVQPISPNDRAVGVAIFGRLRSEDTTEPVAFTIALTGETSDQEKHT